MPDEALISQIENLLAEVVALGGSNERTSIVPNLTVQDANPTNLDGFVIVSDDRDGDNILAKKVGSVIYADNDLVNVMFLEGAEAIAFQQGSQSSNNGIWEIVPSTTTDIFYDKGDVGIGKSVAPDAALEVLDSVQTQLRLTHTEDTKFVDFTLDTNHDLTIDPSSTGQVKLNATVTVTDEIQHEGDSDNKIGFADDVQTFTVGGEVLLTLTEAAQDIVKIGDGGDVDINFNDDGFFEGSTGNFGVGTASPTANFRLHVYKDISSNGARIRTENPNTGTGAFADLYTTASRGSGGTHGFSVQMWGHNATAAWDGITLGNWGRLRTDATTSGVIFTTGGNSPFYFGTNDTRRMTILGSGLIGMNGVTSPSTALDIGAGAMEFDEMTAPGGGAANTARLYAVDNGAGKTQLVVIFNTGAVQVLATQP